MLAVEHSGCRLAWNNLPNEPTALFIFKDAGHPLHAPFPVSCHLLPKLPGPGHTGQISGLGLGMGRWGPTWQAGVGTWSRVSQGL